MEEYQAVDEAKAEEDVAPAAEEVEDGEEEGEEELEEEEEPKRDGQASAEVLAKGEEVDERELDRDQDMLQQACLPVSGSPLPPSDEPPKDADEYLRQVQWERMHVPEVVDVEVAEKPRRRRKRQGDKHRSLLAQFDVPEVPEELGHCPEWAEDVAEAFRELRERCKEARRLAAARAPQEHLEGEAWPEHFGGSRPSTATLAAQDFLSINHLVVAVVDAIVEVHNSFEDGSAALASSDGASPFEVHSERLNHLAEWAFAALSYVDLPLFDEMQYQFQRLRRTCQKLILAEQSGSAPGGDGHSCDVPPIGAFRANANLLLAIVTKVFGQW
mmetsp:Transcript_114561/g.334968  ORF Transcript_114561/g.334968 Transcript_114561/m.334968 type:complete len:329 (-) Transcript_114561:117-1103(-)